MVENRIEKAAAALIWEEKVLVVKKKYSNGDVSKLWRFMYVFKAREEGGDEERELKKLLSKLTKQLGRPATYKRG